MTADTKKIITIVYEQLKSREIDPAGSFDNAGRWYAEHSDLIDVRSPSRAWPYSELLACRAKKYVTAVCDTFKCRSVAKLLRHV